MERCDYMKPLYSLVTVNTGEICRLIYKINKFKSEMILHLQSMTNVTKGLK